MARQLGQSGGWNLAGIAIFIAFERGEARHVDVKADEPMRMALAYGYGFAHPEDQPHGGCDTPGPFRYAP